MTEEIEKLVVKYENIFYLQNEQSEICSLNKNKFLVILLQKLEMLLKIKIYIFKLMVHLTLLFSHFGNYTSNILY